MEMQRTTVQKKGKFCSKNMVRQLRQSQGGEEYADYCEHLSPACLDELTKAQAVKFSRLHRLDQLIQCRVQKINSAHVFNGRVM